VANEWDGVVDKETIQRENRHRDQRNTRSRWLDPFPNVNDTAGNELYNR